MMLKSAVRVLSGTPTLFLEDAPVAAMAYTTYFEERSGYQDFWKAGYNIFFVNASFSTAPINPTTGFTPFDVGILKTRSIRITPSLKMRSTVFWQIAPMR